MSDIIEKIGKQVSEVADTVVEATTELIEMQKLKAQIRGLERSNNRDYCDIGKIVYELYSKNEKVSDEADELCQTIQEREAQIQEMKNDLEARKEEYRAQGFMRHSSEESDIFNEDKDDDPEFEEDDFVNEEDLADIENGKVEVVKEAGNDEEAKAEEVSAE